MVTRSKIEKIVKLIREAIFIRFVKFYTLLYQTNVFGTLPSITIIRFCSIPIKSKMEESLGIL